MIKSIHLGRGPVYRALGWHQHRGSQTARVPPSTLRSRDVTANGGAVNQAPTQKREAHTESIHLGRGPVYRALDWLPASWQPNSKGAAFYVAIKGRDGQRGRGEPGPYAKT